MYNVRLIRELGAPVHRPWALFDIGRTAECPSGHHWPTTGLGGSWSEVDPFDQENPVPCVIRFASAEAPDQAAPPPWDVSTWTLATLASRFGHLRSSVRLFFRPPSASRACDGLPAASSATLVPWESECFHVESSLAEFVRWLGSSPDHDVACGGDGANRVPGATATVAGCSCPCGRGNDASACPFGALHAFPRRAHWGYMDYKHFESLFGEDGGQEGGDEGAGEEGKERLREARAAADFDSLLSLSLRSWVCTDNPPPACRADPCAAVRARGKSAPVLWVGSAGAVTGMHTDSYGCNFVLQVDGVKRWVLLPPGELAPVYPCRVPFEESSTFMRRADDVARVAAAAGPPRPSSGSPFSPSPSTAHPDGTGNVEMGEAKAPLGTDPALWHHIRLHGVIVDLHPGEVLYVPRGWAHQVHCHTDSVSVNQWMPLSSDDVARVDEAIVRILLASLLGSGSGSGRSDNSGNLRSDGSEKREGEVEGPQTEPGEAPWWANPGEAVADPAASAAYLSDALAKAAASPPSAVGPSPTTAAAGEGSEEDEDEDEDEEYGGDVIRELAEAVTSPEVVALIRKVMLQRRQRRGRPAAAAAAARPGNS